MKMELKPSRFFSSRWCMEKLCVVFAIINAVTCLLAFLNSVIFLIFLLVVWIWNMYHGYIPTYGDSEGWTVLNFFIIGAVICSILAASALYFAALLCLGIRNDNKRYIKMYLNYGVTVVTLSVLGLLLYIWLFWEQARIDAVVSSVMCLAYSGILFLINKTYLESDQLETNDRLLSTPCVQHSYGCQ
ncbi:uncharacterized protein LOC133519461 [Cydia pomonella]|uniref:uncharacterized protein LOC133519461 n=1 Tax=Cydia pomonella TaxID=82600 RepID=UPI002ADE88E4|nr:uncharacterized protein LOC133519461 [Cydia pomonella]